MTMRKADILEDANSMFLKTKVVLSVLSHQCGPLHGACLPPVSAKWFADTVRICCSGILPRVGGISPIHLVAWLYSSVGTDTP